MPSKSDTRRFLVYIVVIAACSVFAGENPAKDPTPIHLALVCQEGNDELAKVVEAAKWPGLSVSRKFR